MVECWGRCKEGVSSAFNILRTLPVVRKLRGMWHGWRVNCHERTHFGGKKYTRSYLLCRGQAHASYLPREICTEWPSSLAPVREARQPRLSPPRPQASFSVWPPQPRPQKFLSLHLDQLTAGLCRRHNESIEVTLAFILPITLEWPTTFASRISRHRQPRQVGQSCAPKNSSLRLVALSIFSLSLYQVLFRVCTCEDRRRCGRFLNEPNEYARPAPVVHQPDSSLFPSPL